MVFHLAILECYRTAKGRELAHVGEKLYGMALKNEYLGGFWTDFAKSNAIFSLGKEGSYHLLRSRSQKVSFKVKIESEDGQDVWKN